jgi:hypothetical protein
VISLTHRFVFDERAIFLEKTSVIAEMIGEDFVIAAYERKSFRSGWITDGLAVDCDSKVLVGVQYRIQIREIVPF